MGLPGKTWWEGPVALPLLASRAGDSSDGGRSYATAALTALCISGGSFRAMLPSLIVGTAGLLQFACNTFVWRYSAGSMRQMACVLRWSPTCIYTAYKHL